MTAQTDKVAMGAAAEGAPMRQRSKTETIWRALKHAPPTAWFGMIVVATYIVLALFAPLIAPYAENDAAGPIYAPWSAEYLFGTDQIGRDMLSRSSTARATPSGSRS